MPNRKITFLSLALLLVGSMVVAREPEGEGASPEEKTDPAMTVEESLEVVGVSVAPLVEVLDGESLESRTFSDGAEVLDLVSGVSLGRMGGHGLEASVRGLGASNLNVVVDGAYVHGGCPNRMDPPTSFASLETLEEVKVSKGISSFRYGGGGSAGTVLFERHTEPFVGELWRLGANVEYSTFAASPQLAMDAAIGGDKAFLRVLAGRREMESYEDGGGEEVRSGFARQDALVVAGWTPDSDHRLELSFEVARTDDALFAGAGMDSVYDDGDTYRIRFRRDRALGPFESLEVDVYLSMVDHLMDNFSLRQPSTPMFAQAPSESDTYGGRFLADLASHGWAVTLGLDYQENERHAERFVGPDADRATRLQSVLWPEVRMQAGGLFVEGLRPDERFGALRMGLRWDRFQSSADAVSDEPMGAAKSPEELYLLYYGEAGESWSHDDLSGFAQWQKPVGDRGVSVFAGLSRSVRAADTSERFIASNGSSPAARWVGNPGLEPARHHQIDWGLIYESAGRSSSWSLFYDRTADFILRDRAHGQEGVLMDDNASIYRNVDVTRWGTELSGRLPLGEYLRLQGQLAWVWAENLTDHRPVAQIPPLEGRLEMLWNDARWHGAFTARFALEQDRVDDDPSVGSGLDAGVTPSWLVLDLSGRVDLGKGLALQLGVDNLLDEDYARHLNRSSLFDPDPLRVNEPGRSFWGRLRWSFAS